VTFVEFGESPLIVGFPAIVKFLAQPVVDLAGQRLGILPRNTRLRS
jgi:hypothetical protein